MPADFSKADQPCLYGHRSAGSGPGTVLVVRAGILTATGPKFAAEEVLVKGTLGEGSYGQVFEVRSP